MIVISYATCLTIITVIWFIWRVFVGLKTHKADWKNEVRLFPAFLCIAVIMGIVYFNWNPSNGRLGYLIFDVHKIIPFRINLELFDSVRHGYAGWKQNLWGNIEMFIPIGFIWPYSFHKLDNVGKVVLAGAAFSLFIELSQLLFYQRSTDIDDVITNTFGTLIGAVAYFFIDYMLKYDEKEKDNHIH